MFERLEKYRAELMKAKARRADLDAKIKELERKCKEEENAQIHGKVTGTGGKNNGKSKERRKRP